MQCRLPHKQLSEPFLALEVDLQQRVAMAAAADGSDVAIAAGSRQQPSSTSVDATQGRAQDAACRQLAPYGDVKQRNAATWEQDETLHITVTEPGRWNAVAYWFQLDMGCGRPGVASWQANAGSSGGDVGSGQASSAVGTSWRQSVQYLDGMTVNQVRHVKRPNGIALNFSQYRSGGVDAAGRGACRCGS